MVDFSTFVVPPPTRPTAVLTCAVGDTGEELLNISAMPMAKYAKRIDADFRVIRPPDPANPGPYPLVWKFATGKFLRHYERVIFLDADVVVESDCPNLFEVVPADRMAMHDDFPWLASNDWMTAEYERLAHDTAYPMTPPTTCWNTGVVVASAAHRLAFQPPNRPFRFSHTIEQSVVNLNVHRLGIEVQKLPRVLSWLYFADKQFGHTDGVKLWHFANCPREKRLKFMRQKAGIKESSPYVSIPVIPCEHLGDLDERCTTCGGGSRRDERHRYHCEHPDNDRGRATRGWTGSGFWTCGGCPNYKPLDHTKPGGADYFGDVDGFFSRSEAVLLEKCSRGKLTLEMGRHAGRSLCVAARVAQHVVSIDANPDSAAMADDNLTRHGLQGKATLLTGTTDDVFARGWLGGYGKFGCVLIDADHTEPHVSRDIANAMTVLAPGGFLLIHDVGHHLWPDVRTVVEDHERRLKWERYEVAESLVAFRVPKPKSSPRPADRRPPPGVPIHTRHALMHVAPVARFGGEAWRWNVTQMRMREHQFAGRKVAAVLTDAGAGFSMNFGRVDRSDKWALDHPDAVREALGDGWEVVEIPNDPTLREVATWVPLWSRLEEFSLPGHAAFYCHTKGVTRHQPHIREWTDMMYRACLDYPEKVLPMLEEYPIVGPFKKVGRGWTGQRPKNWSASTWHYSGSFAWTRLDDFFRRNWRGVERFWSGTEAWPGIAYGVKEGGSLILDGKVGEVDLYRSDYIDRVAKPAFGHFFGLVQ